MTISQQMISQYLLFSIISYTTHAVFNYEGQDTYPVHLQFVLSRFQGRVGVWDLLLVAGPKSWSKIKLARKPEARIYQYQSQDNDTSNKKTINILPGARKSNTTNLRSKFFTTLLTKKNPQYIDIYKLTDWIGLAK